MKPEATLVNRAKLRRVLLELAKDHRAHAFTRVSAKVYTEADLVLRAWAFRKVMNHPSVGKTIE